MSDGTKITDEGIKIDTKKIMENFYKFTMNIAMSAFGELPFPECDGLSVLDLAPVTAILLGFCSEEFATKERNRINETLKDFMEEDDYE